MAIKLGLQRMQNLYGTSPQPWKAIHVAGTNGKGSVCSYVSSLLTHSKIPHGRFTSPFIRRPEDSILINNSAIASDLFRSLYDGADEASPSDPPTHFERMTDGTGGRLDSTNVMKNKAVTVITKIGLDHQEYLGNTIGKIAAEKAAIMNGAPCIVNGRNSPEALEVIAETAQRVGSRLLLSTDDSRLGDEAASLSGTWPQHVLDNAICAIKACEQLEEFQGYSPTIQDLLQLPSVHMEGRLQEIDLTATAPGKRANRTTPIILDGAHNLDAATLLAKHAGQHLRIAKSGGRQPITWILGMSSPREQTASEILLPLLHPGDKVALVEYDHPLRRPESSPTPADYFLSFRPLPLDMGKLEAAVKALPGFGGEIPTFVEHVKAGLRCIAEDPQAVLMFSGGPTRKETQLSEAQSYADIAARNGYFSIIPASEAHRVLVEERALDSYYNVLFSLVQFWRLHSRRWPARLTVVSHAFKSPASTTDTAPRLGFRLTARGM
ncbi:unnamed protein product [Parascedosporium putredinis]|uniref:Dihydrofolate synthetase n=1 Tax=Parascedosporium putredinis TaxID=1442378 RepID=A0A9P1H289_9PEZI|nr:unnamed protein product [Parascedosporium putredinis]CAI7995875.1 unnamed protein product [Parascedosporium putredinis]